MARSGSVIFVRVGGNCDAGQVASSNESQESNEVAWSSDRDPLWHLINANFSLALVAVGLRIAHTQGSSIPTPTHHRQADRGIRPTGVVTSVIASIRAGRRWGWDGGLFDLAADEEASE